MASISVELVTKKFRTIRAYLNLSTHKYTLDFTDAITLNAVGMEMFVTRFQQHAAELGLVCTVSDEVTETVKAFKKEREEMIESVKPSS